MEGILLQDAAITHFFNQFLALPIYPVHLKVEVDGAWLNVLRIDTHSADKVHHTDCMLEWLQRYCWPFFFKSESYCKYRLYCQLHGKNIHNDQIPFCQGQDVDIALLEAISGHVTEMGGLGGSLVKIWLACEGHKLGIQQHWTAAMAISQRCKFIPCLSEVVKNSPVWINNVQSRAFERVKFYWLPRTCLLIQISSIRPVSGSNGRGLGCGYSCKEGEAAILNGLMCNLIAGDAFLSYLMELKDWSVLYYKVWQLCHYFTSDDYLQDKLLTEGWKIWTTYLDPAAEVPVKLPSRMVVKLYSALVIEVTDDISQALQEVKVEVLSLVKRLWNKFQRHLYMIFYRMVMEGVMSPDLLKYEDEDLPSVVGTMGTGTVEYRSRRRQMDPKIILDSDIEGGALQTLGDIQTLFQFEQFLYSCKGACSEENTCYKLWKSITQYKKTLPRKRDPLAISIFKTFLYANSKYQIPDDISDLLDDFPEQFSNGDQLRPKSSMLLKIQKIAEEFLYLSIKEFLQKEGKVPQDEMPVQSIARKSKGLVVTQLQEDAAHLLTILSACEGHLTHKLHHFVEYIVRCGHPSLGQVHANGVNFWLEVQKFKVLYESEANINIVYRKAEALTDCYLDTSTLPWVKVAVLPELAIQIVSALGDFYHVRVNAHVERLIDLFDKARQTVFKELCSYWGSFCKVYEPPLNEMLSLPQLACGTPVVSRMGSLQVSNLTLPPLPLLRPNAAPLLSFSKLKGIRWKLPYSL